MLAVVGFVYVPKHELLHLCVDTRSALVQAMLSQAGDSMSAPCVGLALPWFHGSQTRTLPSLQEGSLLGSLARLLRRRGSQSEDDATDIVLGKRRRL